MQALSICWDTRPLEEGGQRWFHLYPDEAIPHDDLLHWTGPNQNWNYMCAECHSTNLRKNYDVEADRYETTWSEIDVSCEACHGPGSNHVLWARQVARGARARQGGSTGLVIELNDRRGASWRFEPGAVTAKRDPPLQRRAELDVCAVCHSRRRVIGEPFVHGQPLMDTHRPLLLEERLYHADGQIHDEVYVWGSFVQSKMYREGVTCSDCHDPHTLATYGEGNVLCANCHLASHFDTPSHHFHKTDSPGARCVECHMPAKNYMVVDPRRDHSMRIPRPDLSVELGTPNACNGCHQDRPAEWSARAVERWYGARREDPEHFAVTLHAGRRGLPQAAERLAALAVDDEMPAIVRATAFPLLMRYAGADLPAAIESASRDADPLVRVAAATASEALGPEPRLRLVRGLLDDPVRAVRTEAARVLVGAPELQMNEAQRASFERVLAEYRQTQRVHADRAESHLNLGLIHAQRGEPDQAEREYRTAIRLEPRFTAAYVNLSDLYRQLNRDGEGEPLLRRALDELPQSGDLHHALGLLLVRQKRYTEALEPLERAAALRPDLPRYGFVYGVALESMGHTERATEVLDAAHRRHPSDRELLYALVELHRDTGATERAVEYGRKLLVLDPEDAAIRALVARLDE